MKQIVILILCIFLLSTNNYAQFRKGPYLQNPTDSSVTIMWQLENANVCTLTYSVDTVNMVEIKSFPKDSIHEVVLPNLIPDTKYYYRIYTNDTSFITFSFISKPLYSSQFSFTVIGDVRPPGYKTDYAPSVMSS